MRVMAQPLIEIPLTKDCFRRDHDHYKMQRDS